MTTIITDFNINQQHQDDDDDENRIDNKEEETSFVTTTTTAADDDDNDYDCCACHGRNLLYSNRRMTLYGEVFPKTNSLLGTFNTSFDYLTYCNPFCYHQGGGTTITTTDKEEETGNGDGMMTMMMCCGPSSTIYYDGGSDNNDRKRNTTNTNTSKQQQLLQVIVDDGIVYDDDDDESQQQEQNLSPKSLMATIDESQNLKINPYHVLQVRRDATDCEIRQSYRRLALWHHPGRRQSTSSCCCDTQEERQQRLQIFEVLAACYETLISKESRRRFDTQYKLLEKQMRSSTTMQQQLTTTTTSVSGVTRGGNIGNGGEGGFKLPEISGGMFMGGKPLFFGSLPSALQSWDYGSGGSGGSDGGRASTAKATTGSKSLSDRLQDANERNDEGSVPALYRSASSVNSSSSDEDDGKEIENYIDPQQKQQQSQTHIVNHMHHDNQSDDPERLMTHSFSSPTSHQSVFSGSDTVTPSLFDSLVPNRSTSGSGSSSDDAVAEKHFTQVETERLFGGPLSDLFRSRNFQPFTDSFQVFEDVFGSKIFHTSVEEIGGRLRKWSPTIVQSKVVHSKNTTSGLVTSQEVLPDDKNTCVIRTSRQVQHRKLTRTETITIDPKTRQRYSVVTVTTEEIPALKQKQHEGHHEDGITAGSSGGDENSFAFFFQIMKYTTPGCGDDYSFWPNSISSGNMKSENNKNNNEEPWCDIFALCHQLSEEAYSLQRPPYSYGWINWANALECFPTHSAGTTTG